MAGDFTFASTGCLLNNRFLAIIGRPLPCRASLIGGKEIGIGEGLGSTAFSCTIDGRRFGLGLLGCLFLSKSFNGLRCLFLPRLCERRFVLGFVGVLFHGFLGLRLGFRFSLWFGNLGRRFGLLDLLRNRLVFNLFGLGNKITCLGPNT